MLLIGMIVSAVWVAVAFVQWTMVGSCLPMDSQKAAASNQLTPDTGCSAVPST